MIKKRDGTMLWGGYAKAAPRHLTLRLDRVRWPSPLLPINTGGEPEIEGGQDFEERHREEGETKEGERRFWGGGQKF
jgi:hypothetical protein